MKPTFLNQDKPLLCAMLQYETPKETIGAIRNGLAGGAEAFGLQWESTINEHRNMETFKNLISAMSGKPCYVTNYRSGVNRGKSDEDLAKEMLELAENGATLCDVMGDMFLPTIGELTTDKDAVRKQMEYIDALHEKGAEVLMSSHVLKYEPAEMEW